MAYQQKPNTGSLFKNLKKSKENQPDYSGSCIVNGQEMNIGAWLKTSQKGEKFFSMSFRPKQDQAQQSNGFQKPMPPQQKPGADDWGDGVPF